ncbi:MAG TPA: sigma-70 family RNA polymerase sigma factor [Pyrinomonadaceae bacterium]|nr:sigma-70 family RNA polymerase sigma factor [Pyrinomonadaceae bacterium]
MARDSAIPPESFDEILSWFNTDRDTAASIYLQLRSDLEKLFTLRRCHDPRGLVDQTFDRVARKVSEVKPDYDGDPKLYFYGVARNLIKEDSKKIKSYASLEEIEALSASEPEIKEETDELRKDCLHECLQELTGAKRELIRNYYVKEKQAKIDHRAELARRLGTSVNTLRVRVFRIRHELEECIEQCLDRKAQRK